MTNNLLTKNNTLAGLTSSKDGVNKQLAGVSHFMEEIWKGVTGYERFYQISNLGRLKSLKRKRVTKDKIIRLQKDKDGYLIYSLSLGSRDKKETIKISRCVAEAFISKNKKGMVCHKDGNKLNNRADNLYYGDLESNTLDKYRHGTTKLSICQTIEIRDLYPEYSQKELSAIYGVRPSTISRIINNVRGKFI
jgi:hypothetical protein